MLILAIDTALEACAAALFDTASDSVVAQQSQSMKRGHAEALMPLIAGLMAAAECPFTALDRIAVTTGPGSFTGLRVGIAAARGFALAADVPAIGVTTLSAFAAPHGSAPVLAAIDARHDCIYFQITAADGTMMVAPRVAGIDEAVRAAGCGEPLHLVGNAAHVVAGRWGRDQAPPQSVDSQPAPDIAFVARLAARAEPGLSPARPFYLRPPEAIPSTPSILPVGAP